MNEEYEQVHQELLELIRSDLSRSELREKLADYHDADIADVLSELDSGRQEYLLNSLQGVQTFITCTGLENFVRNRVKTEKVYHVTDGVITNDERI